MTLQPPPTHTPGPRPDFYLCTFFLLSSEMASDSCSTFQVLSLLGLKSVISFPNIFIGIISFNCLKCIHPFVLLPRSADTLFPHMLGCQIFVANQWQGWSRG